MKYSLPNFMLMQSKPNKIANINNAKTKSRKNFGTSKSKKNIKCKLLNPYLMHMH